MRMARVYRREGGYTLTDVSQATGIHRAHLSQFETGSAGLSRARAERLAKFYGKTVDELYIEYERDIIVPVFATAEAK